MPSLPTPSPPHKLSDPPYLLHRRRDGGPRVVVVQVEPEEVQPGAVLAPAAVPVLGRQVLGSRKHGWHSQRD